MMAIDEWVMAAMTDDMVVVHLLVRLKQAQAASLSPKSLPSPPPKVLLTWGLKQPRSRTAQAASRCDGALSTRKDAADSIRRSPTTPLSWSGGASPSATADGCEESSRPLQSTRSKGTAAANCNSNTANTKSSRRRKASAEIKGVENYPLLEERVYLRQDFDTLHTAFKPRRATSQSSKRIKLDFVPDSRENASVASDYGASRVASRAANHTPSSSCDTRQTNSTPESSFRLPDLNMIPSEDDSSS